MKHGKYPPRDTKEHEGKRENCSSLHFLRDPSCPSWMTLCLFSVFHPCSSVALPFQRQFTTAAARSLAYGHGIGSPDRRRQRTGRGLFGAAGGAAAVVRRPVRRCRFAGGLPGCHRRPARLSRGPGVRGRPGAASAADLHRGLGKPAQADRPVGEAATAVGQRAGGPALGAAAVDRRGRAAPGGIAMPPDLARSPATAAGRALARQAARQRRRPRRRVAR